MTAEREGRYNPAEMEVKILRDDPWKHRTDGMRCKTCMWFAPKLRADRDVGAPFDLGRCRRHAPTMSGYPAVFVNDWCGDHKIDENRI
jgi:hypothetical protein